MADAWCGNLPSIARMLRFSPIAFLVLSLLHGGILSAWVLMAACLICIAVLFVMRYDQGVFWVVCKSGNGIHTTG